MLRKRKKTPHSMNAVIQRQMISQVKPQGASGTSFSLVIWEFELRASHLLSRHSAN
jgi:hypothetical protein